MDKNLRKPKVDYSKFPLYRDKDGRRRRLGQTEIQWIKWMASYLNINNDRDVDCLRHNIKCRFDFKPSRKWVRDLLQDKIIYKWSDIDLKFKSRKNNDLAYFLEDILAILTDKEWGKNEKSFHASMEILLPEVRYYKGLYYNLRVKFNLTSGKRGRKSEK